jgi:hypothetical protein
MALASQIASQPRGDREKQIAAVMVLLRGLVKSIDEHEEKPE